MVNTTQDVVAALRRARSDNAHPALLAQIEAQLRALRALRAARSVTVAEAITFFAVGNPARRLCY